VANHKFGPYFKSNVSPGYAILNGYEGGAIISVITEGIFHTVDMPHIKGNFRDSILKV
jgi:hypothetical protein